MGVKKNNYSDEKPNSYSNDSDSESEDDVPKNTNTNKTDTKTDKDVIEGMTTAEFKSEFQETIGNMKEDLINFAKWSVINVIIVAIIWKIGSHIIWLNSIPRTLLKLMYPPGYEYVKQILAENMANKECSDVVHNGGVTTVVAEYEPDQEETFRLRKACCPELEPPFKPGSNMEVPCWPMGTTKSTLTKMQKQNYAYRVWDNDFKKCVNYVKWKSESDYAALQAKQQAIQGRIQLVKAQNKEIRGDTTSGGGVMMGGGDDQRDFLKEMSAKEKEIDRQRKVYDAKRKDPFVSKEDEVVAENKIKQLERELSGIRFQMVENEMPDDDGKDPLEGMLSALGTQNEKGLSDNPLLASSQDDARQSTTAAAKPLAEDHTSAAAALSSVKGVPSGSSGMGMAPELHANVLTKSRENILKEYMETEDFQNANPTQQQGMLRSLNNMIGNSQIDKMGKRSDINIKSAKKVLKMQLDHEKNMSKLSTAAAKRHQDLELKRIQKIAKIHSKMIKEKRNGNIKMAQKLRKLIKANQKAEAKYKVDMQLKMAGQLQDQELKAFEKKEKALLAMSEKESKLNMKNTKAAAAGAAGALKAFCKMVWSAIKTIFNSIWLITVAILGKLLGCSWGQGWQGIILGPNTLTSLGANFKLAIKSSLSWIIYSCINASGGNIITAFLLSTFFLTIGVGLMQTLWVSPLSTIWTLLSFKWPQLIMILSIIGFPILSTVFGLVYGIMYALYSIIYVLGFWFKCLTTKDGYVFKRQLRSCSSAQKSLRRLFFILTLINGVKHLDPKVVTGMIIAFLYIEYKSR